MDCTEIEKMIISLYDEQKWMDIANINYSTSNAQTCRLFWVLPTLNDLYWISDMVKKHKLLGIVSIGSGCGLLEWLLQKCSGLDIVGVELDDCWWKSKHAPPIFLENMIYVKDSKNSDLCVPEKYALLFCYFNNATAFHSYIKNYKGDFIFVIGPKEGEHRTTDPLPFDEKFTEHGWKVLDKRILSRSKDYIVLYNR